MRAGKLNPIVGVVPTGGDLDQVLGLLHLRELEPIHIYATASIRRLLREQNIFFNMVTSRLGKASGRILCREKGSRRSFGGIYQQAGLQSYIARWRSSGLRGRKNRRRM